MTNQPPPELFAERPVRSEFVPSRSYRIRRVVTCAILIGLVGGGVYSIYLWKRGPSEIPTIMAELPLKQKPEQPGGIDIPNQDVLAYQQIDNSANKPPVEHLLPPPETPQPATTAAPNEVPASAPNSTPPAVETLAAPSAPSAPPPSEPATAAAPQNVPAASPAPPQPADMPPPAVAPVGAVAATENAQPEPVIAKPPAPEVAAPPPVHAPAAHVASGRKGFRVQLASFPDKELAEHQLSHMQKKYAASLGPARLHLAKADLGSRGIYYRVQSNPITDNEARSICAALKNAKAGCIIVKP